jgi:hypothetical protein
MPSFSNREAQGCTNSETSDGQMLLCNCKGIGEWAPSAANADSVSDPYIA